MARLSARLNVVGSILAGMTLLAPLGIAQAQAQTKIAVVNVPRLLDEAPQAKTAMQALQEEFAPRQREIVQQQKDLKAKEEKLQRDGAVMAENERRNSEKDLREGQRELARKQNEYVEDLNLRRNEEIGKLQRSLLQEVQAFARTANYDLIVGEGVLYVNESMDITAQVLSALQARYKATGGATPKPATPKPAAGTTPPPPKPQQ
jgi:outer membrane protein